jgi:hypothetical protein
MAEQDSFTVKEAALYLGVAPRTFQHYLYNLKIVVPDGYVSTHPWFGQETLETLRRTLEKRAAQRFAFRDKQGHPLYTITQAARLLGMSVAVLSYHYNEGNIVPDEVRLVRQLSRALFREDTLRAFFSTKRPEGRPTKEPLHE